MQKIGKTQKSLFTLFPGQYLQYNPQQSWVEAGQEWKGLFLFAAYMENQRELLPIYSSSDVLVKNAFSISSKSVHIDCGIRILPKCIFFISHFVHFVHCSVVGGGLRPSGQFSVDSHHELSSEPQMCTSQIFPGIPAHSDEKLYFV